MKTSSDAGADRTADAHAEALDVIIVGAGLSGIGAACHLERRCPTKRYAILESRNAIGGTWDLFRYPGIRSDSDMFTLGYDFKPWRGRKSIADGASIREYVEEAAREHGVDEHIRFDHRVVRAEWSSATSTWTVHAERAGEPVALRCNFLLICAGYYDYDQGHTPDFEDRERFRGRIIHPQNWPADLDYGGKRVVVVGSGATAMTLVPAMAERAEHVVMLQRSPTYVVAASAVDPLANFLRRFLPERVVYAITRFKNNSLMRLFFGRVRKHPRFFKRRLIERVRKELGDGYDVATHFTPRYDPWDQRLCLIRNGDLFEAMRVGKVSVVTDEVDRFTERGIALRSGEALEADLVVTATGLNLKLLGGATFHVDGKPIDFAETYAYKGMMCSGVPNLVWTFGYINASWTLRADLNAEFTCRLLAHMDAIGARSCTPELRAEDQGMAKRPWIADFTPGYMQRSMHLFPRQGDRDPWLNHQRYHRDKRLLRRGPLEDGVLIFRGKTRALPATLGSDTRTAESAGAP